MPLTPEQISTIINQYHAGMGTRKLAEANGCSRQVIKKLLDGQTKAHNHGPKLTAITQQEIINAYNAGASAHKLAESYDCTTRTITTMLKKSGVIIRNKNERMQAIPHTSDHYDKDLTQTKYGNIGPLVSNPMVVKICISCGLPCDKRYHSNSVCDTCIGLQRSQTVNNPDVKAKLSAAAMSQWDDPEFRKLVVDSSKAIWEDPERRERMSTLHSNPDSYYTNGWHESSKVGRVYYRSSYELLYFHYLDNNNAVLKYEVEPFDIQYEFAGVRRYRPDVLVTYCDTQELVEIKPINLISKPKNIAKIAAGRAYCESNSLIFVLITEIELAKLTISDVRATLRYRQQSFTEE